MDLKITTNSRRSAKTSNNSTLICMQDNLHSDALMF